MTLRKKLPAFVVAAASAAVASAFGLGVTQARGDAAPVFDWSVTDNSTPGYTPAPFLTDASAQAVHDFLLARYNSNHANVLAVKVNGPISNATAQLVFGTTAPGAIPSPVPYSVKFVFADIELPGGVSAEATATAALVKQIKGTGSNSAGAYIGEFNFSPNLTDGTRLTQGQIQTDAASFQSVFTGPYYKSAMVNMANPAAYPGSPDFLAGPGITNPKNDPSGAPDIRSALFILPIDRITFSTVYAAGKTYSSAATVGQDPGVVAGSYMNIPWIARFNNYGNTALDNVPNYAGYKYAFQTTNQLLSRNDFAAQVLQYRLRGATSFNLFNYGGKTATGAPLYSSVIGYTTTAEQADALKGWNYDTNGDGSANSVLGGILSRTYGFANLINKVPGATATAAPISSIASGMMLSGVYDKTTAGGAKRMVLMLSNLSEATKNVYFSQKIGGAAIDLVPNTSKFDQLDTIAPGSHELLTFTLNPSGSAWVLTNGGVTVGAKTYFGQSIFASSDAMGDRAGVGVPEPASLGLLSLAGVGLLARRRRAV